MLETLCASKNEIKTVEAFEVLSQNPKLRSLDFNNNQIDNEGDETHIERLLAFLTAFEDLRCL